MNIKDAALECKKLIEANRWETDFDDVSSQHCIDMCNDIINKQMEDDKSNRWLGWVQSCMYTNGISTLNELKEINKPIIMETTALLYGYCPTCYAPGIMRERRLNGDDKCKNGHWYPSKDALLSQPEK